jgi:hypothetical protein
MAVPVDSDRIAGLGWRQGAILGPKLSVRAAELAPRTVTAGASDWLIVTSHDCDVVSPDLAKEPFVEILRARVLEGSRPDAMQLRGRNPRVLQLQIDHGGRNHLLAISVHERWSVPRELLLQERPAFQFSDRERRLIAQWLAKRYLRAAFPSSFDRRWRIRLRDWVHLLSEHSELILAVYLRLSTRDELPPDHPYRCHLLVVVPAEVRAGPGWTEAREKLEHRVRSFWEQFAPGIQCVGVEPLGADEVTLAALEPYQCFDADFVSYEDGTEMLADVVITNA